MYTLRKEDFNTRTMVKISVLGVIAFILMLLDFPLWFTPPFLKFDVSDVPALIGSFALGPMAGVIVQLVKNLLKILLAGTNTAVVGEIANFIVGSVFAYVAGLIYYKEKTFKNAVIGLVVGTIAMTVVISIANYYIMIPFYAKAYGMPLDKIITISGAVNKYVVDLKSLIIFAVIPFNLLKGVVVSLITILLYKRVSPILKS
ncbi:riboflavin transporter FmnP [Keratinibaculum paraultunense]|uniref:Riboflavin transporter n=1 Tax=Keratinibaculum paraultunense TaxID=1278232 RepID=A0A4R3L2P2_9FIRM|nr:ECF transporter S component [Keratinibaculum paraultunense]QQY80101.1 ECF transporter S component [Keratinibaculum paraultunense]TCS91577.1 riboflavin transporter FmnP [Keratinibaculum paraultunense]